MGEVMNNGLDARLGLGVGVGVGLGKLMIRIMARLDELGSGLGMG